LSTIADEDMGGRERERGREASRPPDRLALARRTGEGGLWDVCEIFEGGSPGPMIFIRVQRQRASGGMPVAGVPKDAPCTRAAA
jgi:hypothetical protein